MFGFKKETGAQLYDRFVHRLALSMLVLAIVYALEASGPFVAHDIAHKMKWAEGMMGLLTMFFLVPVTIKLVWFRVRGKPGLDDQDGFIASAYKEAAAKGFLVGFIALQVVLIINQENLAAWSMEVSLYIILALMLGVLSVSFLIANREPASDDGFVDGNAQ